MANSEDDLARGADLAWATAAGPVAVLDPAARLECRLDRRRKAAVSTRVTISLRGSAEALVRVLAQGREWVRGRVGDAAVVVRALVLVPDAAPAGDPVTSTATETASAIALKDLAIEISLGRAA